MKFASFIGSIVGACAGFYNASLIVNDLSDKSDSKINKVLSPTNLFITVGYTIGGAIIGAILFDAIIS